MRRSSSHSFLAIAIAVPWALLAPPARATGTACPATLPDTITVVQQIGRGGPEVLRVATVPRPEPRAGEVLVEIVAAAINPIDWKLRERSDGASPANPRVLGQDIAGTIVAVGPGVDDWHCGDAVVAFLEDSRSGGYAEYVATSTDDLAPKPKRLSFAEGAGYPLTSLTAWSALVDGAKIEAGERVLIQGGAGGVGSMGIQIAKARGAYVITTASARNADFVRSIGADEVIDYTAVRFEDAVRDVDVVFDAVGGDTLARSPAVVRRGGRLVTVAGRPPADACAARGITCMTRNAEGVPATLRAIGDLIDAGRIRVHVDATYPLAQAAAAQEKNKEGHVRGKIVLQVRPEPASKS